MNDPPLPLRITVLLSGGGTTLANLLEVIGRGELPAEVGLVISSSASSRGVERARAAGLPTRVIERGRFPTLGAFSDEIFSAVRQAGAELVVMGGWLKLVEIPADFAQRVVNIHPSLIPAFCGQGFYGHRVHQAVLDYGAKVTGCTVHFVDNQYDHGPIILQRTVPVLDDDTAVTLAERVFSAECEAYPEALRLYAAGRLELVGRRVRIRD